MKDSPRGHGHGPEPTGYTPMAAFAAPARERAELWRTAAGLVVMVVVGITLYQLALAVMATALGPDTLRRVLDETTFFGDTALGTLLSLASFAVFAAGLALALQSLHGRPFASLIGPPGRAAHDFLRVAGWIVALQAALMLLLPQDYTLERNEGLFAGLWLALLPVSFAALMLQAGTEELVFRGYLQQQLAARFGAGLWPVWMAVPAALFGVAHWAPGATGANAGLYMAWAFAFGIAAADLTARTGTIGAALGLHVANNGFAVLVTALAGPGSGLALWHVPLEASSPELAALLPAEFATLLVAWLTARLALRV